MFQYLTAFGAGAASFFSPCVLPLLPGYLSMLSGFSASELLKGDSKAAVKKPVINALIFVAGFSLAFSVMGAAASFIGALLAAHRSVLLKIFGVIMALLGAHMTGLVNINLLNYEKRASMRSLSGGGIGSFLMGFAFALGWSPCIGPVLAAILGMAAVSGKALQGMSLLFAYSMGLAVPFILAAFLTARFFAFIGKFKSALHYVEIAAGLVLILAGALVFFDRLMFLAWISTARN
ncbi:MAG: cytochrome c biogenesis protein CcdA [Elusimicrobia bacterium]|nr:cytochrome c biogenesis protein CcdA [Elusimicrobiota bacterium]